MTVKYMCYVYQYVTYIWVSFKIKQFVINITRLITFTTVQYPTSKYNIKTIVDKKKYIYININYIITKEQ